jgi:hypothetical protein
MAVNYILIITGVWYKLFILGSDQLSPDFVKDMEENTELEEVIVLK